MLLGLDRHKNVKVILLQLGRILDRVHIIQEKNSEKTELHYIVSEKNNKDVYQQETQIQDQETTKLNQN